MLRTLKKFETELYLKDEFQTFKETLFAIKEVNSGILTELYNWLPANKREYLKEVLSSQRLILDKGGKQETEARKIVKARARKVALNQDVVNMANGGNQQ